MNKGFEEAFGDSTTFLDGNFSSAGLNVDAKPKTPFDFIQVRTVVQVIFLMTEHNYFILSYSLIFQQLHLQCFRASTTIWLASLTKMQMHLRLLQQIL